MMAMQASENLGNLEPFLTTHSIPQAKTQKFAINDSTKTGYLPSIKANAIYQQFSQISFESNKQKNFKIEDFLSMGKYDFKTITPIKYYSPTDSLPPAGGGAAGGPPPKTEMAAPLAGTSGHDASDEAAATRLLIPKPSLLEKILTCIPVIGVGAGIIKECQLIGDVRETKGLAEKKELVKIQNQFKWASIIRGINTVALVITGVALGILNIPVAAGIGMAAVLSLGYFSYTLYKNYRFLASTNTSSS